MAGATHALMNLARIREQADQIPPAGKTLEIVLSEYGVWPADSKDARDFSNLARAIYDADLLLHLLRHGGHLGVTAATGWNLHSNTETALIKFDWNTGRILLRPQYYSMGMLRKLMGGRLLPVTTEAPVFNSPRLGNMEAMDEVPLLHAVATLHEGGKIRLFVVNRHLTKELKTNIRLRNCRASGPISVTTLTAPSPSSHNEENPRAVQPMTHSVEGASESVTHAFPPQSLTLLELDGS
jgi:alpha-N-arabinofuranosidase